MPKVFALPCHGMPGHAIINHERASSRTQDTRKPIRTRRPLPVRENWCISSGMNNSFKNEVTPPKRSAHDTSAHSMPTAPSATNSTGNAPAGIETIRRNDWSSNVGITASSHGTARMPVAEVDQGSETASATARQSANRAKFWRSSTIKFRLLSAIRTIASRCSKTKRSLPRRSPWSRTGSRPPPDRRAGGAAPAE